jgi:uncharacterized protein (TIGR00369 family)
MDAVENLKYLPPRSDGRCFVCGPDNPIGLKMKFYTDETTVMSRITIPEDLCGWNNIAHGGILSALLDEVMSWAAIYFFKKLILTKSITVNFIKPVFVGHELKVIGKVRELVSEREAIMEGSIYHDGTLCSSSEGKFALFTPEIAKKLGIMSESDIEELKRFQYLEN